VSSSKQISSEHYDSNLKKFPSNVEISHLASSSIIVDDSCNYYLGMIYPGIDLSAPISGSSFTECGSSADDVSEADVSEVYPYVPSLPGHSGGAGNNGSGIAGGSLVRSGFTFNNNTLLAGGVYLYGDGRPTLNLNQSVPDGTKLSGDLWLRGNPNIRVNGGRDGSNVLDRITNLGGTGGSRDRTEHNSNKR